MHKKRYPCFAFNHRGMALITVLLVMLVLAILATGVIVIAVSNYNQSSKTNDHNQSYYVAEAGISFQVKSIESIIEVMLKDNKNTAEISTAIDEYISKMATNIEIKRQTFENVNGQPSSFVDSTVSVVTTPKNYINIVSQGTVGSVTRTLSKQINLGVLINKAIITQGKLGINATDVILDSDNTPGPVQTLSSGVDPLYSVVINQQGSVSDVWIKQPPSGYTFEDVIENCEMVGVEADMTCRIRNTQNTFKVFYDNSTVLPDVKLPIIPSTTSKLNFDAPISQTNPLIDGSGNITITSATVADGYEFLLAANNDQAKMEFIVPTFTIDGTADDVIINVGDKAVKLVVNQLNLGGEFKIAGDGSLTIFVDVSSNLNKLKLTCKQIICGVKGNVQPENANQFILVVSGNETQVINFADNKNSGATYYMSLITRTGLNLKLDGNDHFYGYIATLGNSVTLNGAGNSDPKSSLLLYAPKAAVTINGSVSLSGAIISDSYSSNGQAVIQYNPGVLNAPFTFLNPYNSLSYGPTAEN